MLLEGMVFRGRHGVLAAERELGQRFVVDVALYLDLSAAGRTDEVSETVDYGRIYESVRGVVEGGPWRLIEAVAERVAAAVLSENGAVEAVHVRVAKPEAPLRGVATPAVEILRRRTTA